MLLQLIWLMTFLCVASAIWAAIPQPRSTSMYAVNRPHRNRLWTILGWLGRLVPSKDQGAQAEYAIFTGSSITRREFRGIKVVAAAAVVGLSFVVLREMHAVDPLFLSAALLVGFFLPDLWVRAERLRRQQAMLRLLPEVVDLLSLCIGAGLDFLVALTRVVNIPRFQEEALVEELSIAVREIKLGKRRAEALKALAKRVNLPELSSFVRTIVQADRMGTPIAEMMMIHAEDIRLQRWTRAERQALKAPIKILLPLIFCIMPCVAIIVGAPIFLQFMHNNPFGK